MTSSLPLMSAELLLPCQLPRQTMGLEGAPRCVAPRVGVPTKGIASLGQIDGLQCLILSCQYQMLEVNAGNSVVIGE